MADGPEWMVRIEKEEQALLERCKIFVLGSPHSFGGEVKDILYLTPCGRWLRVCSRIAYYGRDDAGEGEVSSQVNSNIAKTLLMRCWGFEPPELPKAPLPGDIELLEDWGDLDPSAFIPDYQPEMALRSTDSSNIQAEKEIVRNALLEQLKSWARNWPRAAKPPQPLGSIDDDSHGNIEFKPKELTSCEADVLRFLLRCDSRLTRVRIKPEMNSSGFQHGGSTIFLALSKLTKLGLLDNSKEIEFERLSADGGG